jgi:hypothetical protein
MVIKTRIGRRIISSISNRDLLAILVSFLFVALISIIIAYHFTPPDNLTMTTGFESGAYANFGERYRQILAREKIHLKLLSSSGSVENLKRLNDKSFHVDAGFVQDGTSLPSETKNLVSLIGIAAFVDRTILIMVPVALILDPFNPKHTLAVLLAAPPEILSLV